MLTNAHNYIIGSPYESQSEETAPVETEDVVLAGPEDMFDEGNSMDLSPIKLFRGLGATETKAQEDSTNSELEGEWSGEGDLDDTFYFRRQISAAG